MIWRSLVLFGPRVSGFCDKFQAADPSRALVTQSEDVLDGCRGLAELGWLPRCSHSRGVRQQACGGLCFVTPATAGQSAPGHGHGAWIPEAQDRFVGSSVRRGWWVRSKSADLMAQPLPARSIKADVLRRRRPRRPRDRPRPDERVQRHRVSRAKNAVAPRASRCQSRGAGSSGATGMAARLRVWSISLGSPSPARSSRHIEVCGRLPDVVITALIHR